MNDKLMSIQDDLICASHDLCEDSNCPLVTECPTEFEIVEGQIIIDRLDRVRQDVSVGP